MHKMISIRRLLRPQFHLRFLFAAITAMAVLLGLWVSWIDPSRRQLEAVRHVKRLQGRVTYGGTIALPLAIVELRDYVQSVNSVNLDDARLTSEDLRVLAAFPHLLELSLEHTNTTDAMLTEVVVLRELEDLNLAQSEIHAEALSCLKQLPHLRRLNLRGTTALSHMKEIDAHDPSIAWMNIKDDSTIWESQPHAVALLNLQEMVDLESLDLSETQVNDADLVKLITLKNLRELRLANTNITDDGIHSLRTISNLQVLDLAGTRASGCGLHHFTNLRLLSLQYCREVSDGVLPEIGMLENLEELDLSHTGYRYPDGTPAKTWSFSFTENRWERLLLRAAGIQDSKPLVVTDAGLSHLHHLRRLRKLNLKDTYATKRGIKDLGRQLPALVISSGSD
jgi:Leucine-rich repeat (LRR) protein